jgi:hypothetical protein
LKPAENGPSFDFAQDERLGSAIANLPKTACGEPVEPSIRSLQRTGLLELLEQFKRFKPFKAFKPCAPGIWDHFDQAEKAVFSTVYFNS